jgi:hypothetical protein
LGMISEKMSSSEAEKITIKNSPTDSLRMRTIKEENMTLDKLVPTNAVTINDSGFLMNL